MTEVVKDFIGKNLYKCEKNVFEALLSLVRYLVQHYSVAVPDLKVSKHIVLTTLVRH